MIIQLSQPMTLARARSIRSLRNILILEFRRGAGASAGMRIPALAVSIVLARARALNSSVYVEGERVVK